MQGVFYCVSLADVDIWPTGYASPYAILPRFSSSRSQRLILQSSVMHMMNNANLELRRAIF
jgi:hypothetical protein